MDGCIIGLMFFLFAVAYFTLGLRVQPERTKPPERRVDARSIDPAETRRAVMQVVDEIHSRWYEGKHADEVVHLHLPQRAEIARHDGEVRRKLRWLEQEAGAVDVVLHYEGEAPIARLVEWDTVEYRGGVIRRAEWRQKEAGCLPFLLVFLVLVVGALIW